MSDPHHACTRTASARSPAAVVCRFTLSFLAIAFFVVLCPSCSGLWTSLQNPIDPEYCKVDSMYYGELYESDDSDNGDGNTLSTKNPVLESLMSASGFQVLYIGFNDGAYTGGDVTAPFVMITTKYIAHVFEVNGVTQCEFPLLNAMTIYDSLGTMHSPWIRSTGNGYYRASDGKSYSYEITTFWADPTVDTSLTYTFHIEAANVTAYDWTPLDRSYDIVVNQATNGKANSNAGSLGLMDGLSPAFSSDFSASDPYWEWSKGCGSGTVDVASGTYTLRANCGSNSGPNLFYKRYPYAIGTDTFAVRVTDGYPGKVSGTHSGLCVTDEKGNLVTAIVIEASGWCECFGPGSSVGVLRKVYADWVGDYEYSSTALGIRHDSGMLYFYANGICIASVSDNGNTMTNAGLMIASTDPGYEARASFDDFTIAQ